jgi:hypothetical protein
LLRKLTRTCGSVSLLLRLSLSLSWHVRATSFLKFFVLLSWNTRSSSYAPLGSSFYSFCSFTPKTLWNSTMLTPPVSSGGRDRLDCNLVWRFRS